MANPLESSSPATPLRVGVAGLTDEGLFHLESLALSRDFTPVAVAGQESRNVDGLGGCQQLSMAELFESDLDLAIIATSSAIRTQTAHEFLSRGTNVLIESGSEFQERDSLEACLQLAVNQNLFCGIWQPELSEPDFLAAKSVPTSGASGTVRSVRLIQHGLARERSSLTVVRQRLTQMLQLVDRPVSQIHSTVHGDSASVTASTLLVEFESGATGLIDVDLAATAAIDTGWILQMCHGGYLAGRQSLIEADGEVYEVPVAATPDDPYKRLAWLLQADTAVRLDHSRRTVTEELDIADLMAVPAV